MTAPTTPAPADGAPGERVSRFRKRPVVVDATQWVTNGDHPLDHADGRPSDHEGAIVRYYRTPDEDGERVCDHCALLMKRHGWIDTLEGGHIVCPGDWIITGVKGEHYPCKPDIFEATYEPATAQPLPLPAPSASASAGVGALPAAICDALDSFQSAAHWCKTEHPGSIDDCSAARIALVAAIRDALSTAAAPPPADVGDAAAQAAWHAGIAEGVARGRREALADVDAACEALAMRPGGSQCSVAPDYDGWHVLRSGSNGHGSATAAILAAAAALTPADATADAAEGGEA